MKITRSKEWYYKAHWIARICAWLCCTLPTVIVGWVQLPMLVTREAETTLTSGAIVVIVCLAYPILKGLLKMLKSPSAWLILWIVALVTLGLYSVPHETLGGLLSVFLSAAIGNTVGAMLFWLSRVYKEKWAFYGNLPLGGERRGN